MENIKKTQKKYMFEKYIEYELEINEKYVQNNIINNLIYAKNRFLLKTLKKEYYKKIDDEDMIIKNNLIDKIKTIKKNDEGLIYLIKN